MRPVIRYLHVPKTAGSSVADALRRAVRREEDPARPVSMYPAVMDTTLFGTFDRWDEVSEVRQRMVCRRTGDLADVAVVTGHYCLDSLLLGASASDVMVLFREPRGRLLSHYRYWRSWSEADHASWDPYDGSRRAARSGWVDFLHDAAIAPQIDNVATRLLLGSRVAPDRFIDPSEVASFVELATTRLEQVGFADVIERGPECFAAVGGWCGLDLAVERQNVTDSTSGPPVDRTELTDGSADAVVAARTAVDRELWITVAERTAGWSRDEALVRSDESFARQLTR